MVVRQDKTSVIQSFRAHDRDTGSSMVQIALLTERINYLTEHFRQHKRDHHSRHGLLRMVNRRRKLLDYLKRSDTSQYQKALQELNLRK